MNTQSLLNLNSFYQSNNSPLVTMNYVSSYYFDSTTERGAVSTTKVNYLSADKIGAGTVVVGINVGSSSTGYVLIDGANNRIIINDGTTNRAVFGDV